MDTYLIKGITEKDSPNQDEAEGEVFYLKMKGDYLRYKAEVAPKDDDKSVKEGVYVSPVKTLNIILNIYIPIQYGYLWSLKCSTIVATGTYIVQFQKLYISRSLENPNSEQCIFSNEIMSWRFL